MVLKQASIKATTDSVNALVDLVPPKYWFAENEEEIDSRYCYNKKRTAPCQELKEKSKKAKKARLDPRNAKTITQLQKEQTSKEEQDNLNDEDDSEDNESFFQSRNSKTPPVQPLASESAEELKTKFSSKLADMQAKRQATPGHPSNKRKKERLYAREQRLKEKREKKTIKKKPSKQPSHVKQILKPDKVQDHITPISQNKELTHQRTVVSAISSKDPSSIKEELSFGNVDFGEKKKSKGPSNRDVKALLKKAEAKELRKQQLASENPEKASEQKEKWGWAKVMGLASGFKIKDSVPLLQKSVQRLTKKKEKSKEVWNKRAGTVAKGIKDKQKKRSENITNKKEERKARKEGRPKIKKLSGASKKGSAGKKKTSSKTRGDKSSKKNTK